MKRTALKDRPRAGRQPRVDAVTSARFKERIVAGAELERDGVVAFRGVDAQRIWPTVSGQRAATRARELLSISPAETASGHPIPGFTP